jgi:hypothetical protein
MTPSPLTWSRALVLTGACLLGTALLAPAAHGDPPGTRPGNNGTVKVDGAPDSAGHANEPHVGCAFRLKFTGFDDGQTADVTIAGQAPSGSGTVSQRDGVDVGGDADLRYTAADLDLAGLTAHPKQGYHLKVTLHTDTPGGVKHKVFWYGCVQATASPTVTPSETVSATPTETPSATVSATVSATETATVSVSPSVTAAVLGVKITRSANAPQVLGTELTRPTGLPFTGSPAWPLAGLGVTALATGGVLHAAATRRRARHLA